MVQSLWHNEMMVSAEHFGYLPDCKSRRLTVTGDAVCTPDSLKSTAMLGWVRYQIEMIVRKIDKKAVQNLETRAHTKVEGDFFRPGAQYQPSSGGRRPSPTDILNMVKPLSFKGDKKVKKRKRTRDDDAGGDGPATKDLKASIEQHQDDDESWVSADAVSDVAGPVIFVLPTKPPTCLACDANGKVFASALENMIDESPSTAEPHDVRQVFIANRIAGTDTFSFKGHHGK